MATTRLPLITDAKKTPKAAKPKKTKTAELEVEPTSETEITKPTVLVANPKKMSVTLEDGVVVIRMPLQTTPAMSSTGKSKVYCSTRGPRRVVRKNYDNTYTPVEVDGGVLKAIASAFVTLAPADGTTTTRTILKKKSPK